MHHDWAHFVHKVQKFNSIERRTTIVRHLLNIATMKSAQILTLLSLAVPAFAATGLEVDVYEGPTECEDESKVKAGDYVVDIHYVGTIDESSEAGEKGKQFDSSVGRGQTFDFQIGVGQVIKGCKYKYTHRFVHEEHMLLPSAEPFNLSQVVFRTTSNLTLNSTSYYRGRRNCWTLCGSQGYRCHSS